MTQQKQDKQKELEGLQEKTKEKGNEWRKVKKFNTKEDKKGITIEQTE